MSATIRIECDQLDCDEVFNSTAISTSAARLDAGIYDWVVVSRKRPIDLCPRHAYKRSLYMTDRQRQRERELQEARRGPAHD